MIRNVCKFIMLFVFRTKYQHFSRSQLTFNPQAFEAEIQKLTTVAPAASSGPTKAKVPKRKMKRNPSAVSLPVEGKLLQDLL